LQVMDGINAFFSNIIKGYNELSTLQYFSLFFINWVAALNS
jgi:hypothetical protein